MDLGYVYQEWQSMMLSLQRHSGLFTHEGWSIIVVKMESTNSGVSRSIRCWLSTPEPDNPSGRLRHVQSCSCLAGIVSCKERFCLVKFG